MVVDKMIGGFMEVVINDLEELKKYMRVYKDKKEIIFKFDEVVFNCEKKKKNHFHCELLSTAELLNTNFIQLYFLKNS